jgi:tetratricopeptide (TPR) repeat protein
MRRLLHILSPLAMLTIVAATFPRSAPDGAAGGGAAWCDQYSAAFSAGAVAALERCLSVDPNDVEAMLELGIAWEAASQPDRAEALYRRALGVEPHDARVHVRLGRLLLARGDRAAARREADAALQWHVGNAPALRLIAEAGAR